MTRFFASRIAYLVPVLLLVSLLTMLMVDLIPGDPAVAILGANASAEELAAVNEALGTNDPLPTRYSQWVGDIVRGDFGQSLRTRQPVIDELLARLPVTLEIAALAGLLALGLSVPLALIAAHRPGTRFDRALRGASSTLISSPSFLTALLLVYALAVTWEVFPPTGWVRLSEDVSENLHHALLPSLALALGEAAVYFRVLRADLVTTLQEDFVLAARARGLRSRYVLVRHALRPSSFSLVTIAGLSLGRLIGGTVIVEVLFGLPGLGQLTVQSILAKDYLMVQGIVMFTALGYVIVNLGVDVLYHQLDPRLRRAS